MFQDEARFGRINEARRCWVPQGWRPEVPVQIVREYTYLFGATSPHDGVLDTLILPEVNADAMSLFLAEVAARHRQDCILMVLDGAGWHRARELTVPPNMRLMLQSRTEPDGTRLGGDSGKMVPQSSVPKLRGGGRPFG